MQKRDGEILYSASDLVNYLECEHLIALDLFDLETPLPKTKDSDQAKLIQDKGYAREADFLAVLKDRHSSLIDIAAVGGNLEQKIANTLQAMRDGFEIIFQATLRDGGLIGHADFLRKVSRPSENGDWSYEVMDTKLARSTKAKFIIQLGFYSDIVGKAQGIAPLQMQATLYCEAGNDRLGGGEGDDMLYGDVSGETPSTLNGAILVKTETWTSTTPMRLTTPYGRLNEQIDGGDDYISNTADIQGGKSRFSQVLWQKYASSHRGIFVTSYRNSSTLIRAGCHGVWSSKRAPSQSRKAMTHRACVPSPQSKNPA